MGRLARGGGWLFPGRWEILDVGKTALGRHSRWQLKPGNEGALQRGQDSKKEQRNRDQAFPGRGATCEDTQAIWSQNS